MIIYKTTNLINGKIYIGQDSNNNPSYLGGGLLIGYAIKKYGDKNFKKEILEFCISKNHLNEREIYWIKFYNSSNKKIGYNIMNGGQGGDTLTGNPNAKAIGEKISRTQKERYKDPNNNPMYGKNHRRKSKIKMRKAKLGKGLGEDNNMARKLYEYDDKENLVKIWSYCKEAADFYGISRGNISNFANINSKRKDGEYKKRLKGHIFSFTEIKNI